MEGERYMKKDNCSIVEGIDVDRCMIHQGCQDKFRELWDHC